MAQQETVGYCKNYSQKDGKSITLYTLARIGNIFEEPLAQLKCQQVIKISNSTREVQSNKDEPSLSVEIKEA